MLRTPSLYTQKPLANSSSFGAARLGVDASVLVETLDSEKASRGVGESAG